MRENNRNPFFIELLGRIILVITVLLAFNLKWWLPLIVAPLFWQVWDNLLGIRSRIIIPVQKLIADGVTWVLWLAYIIYSIATFGKHIANWYGWVIGGIVGLVVAQLLGLLWPHRWHLESIERRL